MAIERQDELDELFDPSTLAAAVSDTYVVLAAQCINFDNREESTLKSPIINGNFTTQARTRLMQNTVSTRILRGLLAASLLCVIVIYCTMRTRYVLPSNPASIAAVASLFAGSQIVKLGVIPSGAQWLSDEELERLFNGYLFRLGW